MIEKVRIRGYRKHHDLTFEPNKGMNILVGDNETGKSTILEAINLALTGRVNGRPAAEELSPYWFNLTDVVAFFTAIRAGESPTLPRISIELFLADEDPLQRLSGANNSTKPVHVCPGVELVVEPNPDFVEEINAYFAAGQTSILPVEFYRVVWRTFADTILTTKPRELSTALIDSRTIRSTSGVDFHLRQMLSDHLDPKEKAKISVAYRGVKEQMTTTQLAEINDRMKAIEGPLAGEVLALAMDQSSRTSWDASITPHVADVPFSMAGLGQQAAVKVALAMDRSIARVVLIEEPENHLSYTSLGTLVGNIGTLKKDDQQVFIATHSSFVLNRLGLDALLLVGRDTVHHVSSIDANTVKYFQRLPGYDTLRLVLARRVVLVEGPSDEIVFERFYKDKYGKLPLEDSIDVVSMRGLSLGRCLEVGHVLDRSMVAMRDNDGVDPAELVEGLGSFLGDKRKVFIGAVADGPTLEPQLIAANGDAKLRQVLGVQARADLLTWMTREKTEGALRIAASEKQLTTPEYMRAAMEFIHDAE
jgi:putative ATP-dependent endonuclease of OLD family